VRARARAATLELLFDVVRRSVDPDHGFDRPVTLQWEFSDAPAWSVRIDNGSTAARPGLDPTADVTLRCRYEDWVDVVAGRRDPRAPAADRAPQAAGEPGRASPDASPVRGLSSSSRAPAAPHGRTIQVCRATIAPQPSSGQIGQK
jgi:Alkyl sulfatase C-terminal